MRKFNHWKALEIALNVVYVVSFIALFILTVSSAREHNNIGKVGLSQEEFYGNYDNCMNCDEID
jgi:hypothetical protein